MLQFLYKKICELWEDPLHRNSAFTMMSTAVLSGSGVIFWIIVSKFYQPAEIGIVTTLITVVSLLNGWSQLGANTSLARFLPESLEKDRLVNTSITLVGLISVILAISFLIGLRLFSPQLAFIQYDLPLLTLFVIFALINSLNSVTDSIFTAYRSTNLTFIVNIFMCVVKIILPIFLIAYGYKGIFLSLTLAVLAALVLSIYYIVFKFKIGIKLVIDASVIRKVFKISIANYLAGIVSGLPALIIPVLILNRLGPADSAYFYMPTIIITTLNVIPRAITQNLLVEGSYNRELFRDTLIKALKISIILFVPTALLVIFFGKEILELFGKTFSDEGYQFLQLSALGCIFGLVGYFSSVIFNVKKEISNIIILSVITTVISISLTFSFLPYKLLGIGIAGLLTQIIMAFINILVIWKNRDGL